MALEVRIRKEFDGFLLDVEFESRDGCMGILGASGCGKSMTLKCIAGIERPDCGRIVLDGQVLFDSRRKINLKPQQREVGYLFQNYALFPNMTVEQNIMAGMKGRRREIAGRAAREIKRFQLDGLEGRYPAQLSGGQQQRTALARMLASGPKLLMLDEPFSALDGYLRDALKLEMQEFLNAYHKDVLMVSHNRDEIYQFCDTMTLLDRGKIVLCGNTREIFKNPRRVEAARLTGCKNLSRARKTGEYQVWAEDWNIALKTADPVEETITYVGIRAHDLRPWGEEGRENAMRVCGAGYTEAPFNRQFLFVNADGGSSRLWWLVNRDSIAGDGPEGYAGELPPYLVFPRESLLLLY